jgi:hypothetical protein
MTFRGKRIRSANGRLKVVIIVLTAMAALSGCAVRVRPRGRLEFTRATMANGFKIRIK